MNAAEVEATYLDCTATARLAGTHPRRIRAAALAGKIRTRRFAGGRVTYNVADALALAAPSTAEKGGAA